LSRLALVVCYKIASLGAFDIKKPIRLGFAIAHDLYCSRSFLVGPECLCSLSNANAFFLHSFSFSLVAVASAPARYGEAKAILNEKSPFYLILVKPKRPY
jgi:hypothetical protein